MKPVVNVTKKVRGFASSRVPEVPLVYRFVLIFIITATFELLEPLEFFELMELLNLWNY
jgi:hypothetical protein